MLLGLADVASIEKCKKSDSTVTLESIYKTPEESNELLVVKCWFLFIFIIGGQPIG